VSFVINIFQLVNKLSAVTVCTSIIVDSKPMHLWHYIGRWLVDSQLQVIVWKSTGNSCKHVGDIFECWRKWQRKVSEKEIIPEKCWETFLRKKLWETFWETCCHFCRKWWRKVYEKELIPEKMLTNVSEKKVVKNIPEKFQHHNVFLIVSFAINIFQLVNKLSAVTICTSKEKFLTKK